MNKEIHALIRLGLIDGIGHAYARKLLEHFGAAAAVFEAGPKALASLLGAERAASIRNPVPERQIQEELQFIDRQDIKVLSVLDKDYPQKLRHIPDAPYLLFSKGLADLNAPRQLAIIGSRSHTAYGKEMTLELIRGLRAYGITIVSGMAYGIDVIAHKAAMEHQLPTLAVLAHGLDRVYPAAHSQVARELCTHGALLTEYRTGTRPDKPNFPMRNRIVAGMTDATIVMETDIKGGAMITAKLAFGYNREVFALPGRATDERSLGCNQLIRTQIAQLISSAEDVLHFMAWKDTVMKDQKAIQASLFKELSREEAGLVQWLRGKDWVHIDELQLKSGMNSSGLANTLLQLEFRELISSLPGKRYKLNQAYYGI